MKSTIVLFLALSTLASQDAWVEHPSAGGKSIAVQQDVENVKFRWAFGAIVGKERKFVPVTRDTQLTTGDELKMLVELKRECFVYVLHRTPKGHITLLFPYKLSQFKEDYKLNKNYYVPIGREWFKLDKDTGRETFYVLASAERLLELEDLVQQYQKASDAKKADLAELIVSEIRNVRKRYRTFTTLAERPITIGGNVRGMEKEEEASRPDVATIATEISANNFYSRSFTVDHK